jgi:CRISPR-associated protein Cas1
VRTVYVVQPGAAVRRNGRLLEVWVGRKRQSEIAVHDLEQLVLMGNIVVTPSALDLLLERGVDVVFLTLHGRYRGRLVSGVSANAKLRRAQLQLLEGPGAVPLARELVRGKAHNQRELLLRHARRHGYGDALRRAATAIAAGIARLDEVTTLDQLRGLEGLAAAAYFRAFGELLRADGFAFDGRNRRPPLDPVNALLSLGYTFLFNAVEAAVQVVGLDPYFGALHAPEGGRPSLVCDLVEEYRAPLVDGLVVAAINQGAMVPDDFEDAGPGEPVVVRREALARFVGIFERRLERPVLYAPTGKRVRWRDVIEQQTRRFARHVLGSETYACHRLA